MPVEINNKQYLNLSEVLESAGVTRQTLWRWRQEGKVPVGRRYRGKQVLFTFDEVSVIREYANRIEPIDDAPEEQLKLFEYGNKE